MAAALRARVSIMQFLVYFIVLLITAGSVIFGVDWLQAPMSPMPASKYELRAAKQPPPPAVQQAVKKPTETTGNQSAANRPAANPGAAGPAASVQAATPAPVQTPVVASVAPPPETPAPLVAPEVAVAPPAPKCDIDACERAYRTFTASDCTYQPSGDVDRRLCTKGTPPRAAQSTPVPDARAQAACNIAACSDAYVSFTAADCTYQPSDGPRRLCSK